MSANTWYLVINGQQAGPMSIDDVQYKLSRGEVNNQTLAFTAGMKNWEPIAQIAQLRGSVPPPPTPMGGSRSHEIDYKIFGEEMQFVEIELDPNETVIAEAGGMMFMEHGIEMETRFGDGSEPDKGFFGKVFEGVKRKLTGESLFMTWFTHKGSGKAKVSFGAPYPGKIIPIDLTQIGGVFICQKDSFLAAAMGTKVGIAFTQKMGAGFFGGEGFIMQKLEGDGMAFVHAGGTIVQRRLGPGETLRVDTGCIVGYTQSIDYDIQMVRSVKSVFFGGEGLFFATLTGPGDVWLQSLPLSRLAGRIFAAAPQTGGGGKGEGSVLGGLGNILDGD